MRVEVEYDRIDEYQREAHKRIKQALADGAVITQADAMEFAPYDTGRLRSSLTTRETGPLSYEVYTNIEYAAYQEYGTRHQPGKAFMRPSYEQNRPRIIEMLNRELSTL